MYADIAVHSHISIAKRSSADPIKNWGKTADVPKPKRHKRRVAEEQNGKGILFYRGFKHLQENQRNLGVKQCRLGPLKNSFIPFIPFSANIFGTFGSFLGQLLVNGPSPCRIPYARACDVLDAFNSNDSPSNHVLPNINYSPYQPC